MRTLGKKGTRLGLAMLGMGMWLGTAAAPAAAQLGQRPGDSLSHNLRLLAANPKSITALMGAGRAALELGDPQAALTFFARAEEVTPRDGRVKMWIASALVQMQQSKAALKFFGDAVSLGVPEAEVAGARGLAHDISGNPAAAQRDYRLALTRGPSAEISRRLALSLGITGEREAALRVLEDQLLIRDPEAERARALVLALCGDSAGAARAVSAAMPGPQASAMSPFLARLPTLAPADRALAVHLGVFPRDARPAGAGTAYAAATNSYPPAVTDAGRPDSGQTSLARRGGSQPPASTAPRRRPGSEAPVPSLAAAVRRSTGQVAPQPATQVAAKTPEPKASRPNTPAPVSPGPKAEQPVRLAARTPTPKAAEPSRTAPARRATEWDWSRGSPITTTRARPATERPAAASAPVQTPVQTAAKEEPKPAPATAAGTPVATADAGTSPPAAPVVTPPQEGVSTVQTAVLAPSSVGPGFSIGSPTLDPPLGEPAAAAAASPAPAETLSAAAEAPAQPAPEPRSETVPAGSRLADLSAALAGLPDAVRPEASKPAARAAAAPAKPAAATPKPAAAKKPAAPTEPARHWVQVAGGADKTALPREFARLKAKAPKLLAARSAWSTPLNATNRLLVGPFDSAKAAQEFVNGLKEADLTAFAWQSAAGQKIEKLPAK